MAMDLTTMSSLELATFIKQASAALEKKVKLESKILAKMETKKAESAPPKGVLPPQFAENHEWVQFVHQHMLTNGWESFIHKEIGAGRQSVEVEYPQSEIVAIKDADGKEQVDEDGDIAYCYAFEGSVSAKFPSGQQPLLSHAMRLSKMYRTTKPEVYQEFLASYVPPAPVASSSSSSSSSSAVAKPVLVMTKAQRDAQKEEKEREKEAEKARKKAEREAERKEKARLKEEAAEKAKRDKEQAKALKASGKLVPKGVVRVPVPIAKPAASSSAASASFSAAKPISVPKPVMVKKPVPTIAWIAPSKGEFKRLMLNSVNYFVDHLNRVFPPETDEEGDEVPSDCVGVYKPASNTISDDDIPEDE